MRNYRINASTTVRTDYAIELVAGMKHFPQTASETGNIEKRNAELCEAYEKRRALHKPVLVARADVRFAELGTDQIIRSSSRAAEVLDGGRRGLFSRAIFPKGVNQVVKPSGRGQIRPTRDLIDRIEQCKLPGIDAYRNEWLPKLKAALAVLEAAVAKHDAARTAYDTAFKVELGLREAHHMEIDRIMGVVRAAFPRDRAIQDAIFPVFEGAGAAEEEDGMEVKGVAVIPEAKPVWVSIGLNQAPRS